MGLSYRTFSLTVGGVIMFTFSLEDEVYSRLLDQSARLAGVAPGEPICAQFGVEFCVSFELADGECRDVSGVLIARSMEK